MRTLLVLSISLCTNVYEVCESNLTPASFLFTCRYTRLPSCPGEFWLFEIESANHEESFSAGSRISR